MAASKKNRSNRGGDPNAAQEDEADIVAEVGAELDEESGDLLADAEKIAKIGAVDAESVRENRRVESFVNQKRAGKDGISFNAGDLLSKFEAVVKIWPPNTLDIGVKRLTGTPVEHIIISRPRSASELYRELMTIHGQYEEAKYQIKIVDSNSKQYRANGQIVLPDTRVQQGQPMTAQYPQQPGYPPQQQPWQPPAQQPQQTPPAYPPQPPGAPQPPAQQPAPQAPPQQPPIVMQTPQGPNPMDVMQQTFDMFRQMQDTLAAQQAAQPHQQAPAPQMPQAPPTDPTAMMQQMWDMFQQMVSTQQQPGAVPQAAPQQAANPMAAMMGMMGAPPIEPPAGTIWVPGFGFVPLEKMAQVFGGGAAMPQSQGRVPYRPPTPPGGAPYTPPAPPAPPKSAAEQFQEAVGIVQTAVDAVRQVDALIPKQPGATAPAADTKSEDESPVKVMDMGDAKLLFDKEDGTLRPWETLGANAKGLMDWVAEQREKRGKEEETDEEEDETLPVGYVRVKPGYQPPPGTVAVPVDPSQIPQQPAPQAPQQTAPAQAAPPPQQGLTPPPENVPPPMESTPPPQRQWGAPVRPSGEGG